MVIYTRILAAGNTNQIQHYTLAMPMCACALSVRERDCALYKKHFLAAYSSYYNNLCRDGFCSP